MKVRTRFFATLVVFALLGFCGGGALKAQPEPYRLAVIIDLTGPNAFAGSLYATSLRIFEKYVNAHGGINGRPLQFDFLDDQTNPQTAVQLASQVIAKHPVAFFGGSQTQSCAAVAALVANGPVDYCISPGYYPQKGGYAFASSPSLRYIIATHLRFAKLKRYARVAVINPTDATGQASDKTLDFLFALPEYRDLKVVDQEHFNSGDMSVAAQVARIKAARPDVVICYAGGAGFGTVLRNLNDAGVHVPVLTSSANINPTQLDQYKNFLPPELYFNGVVYQEEPAQRPASLREPIEAFLTAFKDARTEVSPGSGIAWDPAWILVSALRKLGPSVTADQLRDYLLNLHGFNGVSGTYDFRIGDQHGLTDNGVIVVKWDPAKLTFPAASRPGGYLLPASAFPDSRKIVSRAK